MCQKYAILFLTDIEMIANKILARAKRHGAGWVFSAKHFTDLGDRAAVDQALKHVGLDYDLSSKVERTQGRKPPAAALSL